MNKIKIFIVLTVIATAIFSYTLASCKKDEPIKKSSEKDILSFVLAEQADTATIDKINKTISIKVKYDADLSKLSPLITISAKATINPASGVITDFSSGSVIYKVTAEDKTTQDWTVSITKANELEKKILSFTIAGQSADAIIRNDSVNITVEPTSDLTSLTPAIIISDGTTINPSSGTSVDFSKGPVKYIITAKDGSTKDWIVNVVKRAAKTGYLITSFTIAGQVSSGGTGGTSLRVIMPAGTNISSLTPTIVLSEGATVSPASGVAQDFSKGEVSYTVTSESGRKVVWTVLATYPMTSADNSNIKYVGRVDFTTPVAPRFSAPGIYLTTRFSGPNCDIDITDERGMNYIVAVIDNNEPVRIKLSADRKTYRLASGLTNTVHTLLVCKETEAAVGYIEIDGLRCGELSPVELPTRKIECYGNSITAGSCMLNDYCDLVASNANWNAANSGYRSFGAVAARDLNAQWQLTAISGIGLIKSCCNNAFEMPDRWDLTYLDNSKTTKWDFTKYVPDVVTICLGQNDGPDNVLSVAFKNEYITFINNIRSKYANASIFCLTSPSADQTLLNAMKTTLTAVVDSVNKAGDSKVYWIQLPNGLLGGCPTNKHPNVTEHQTIAAALETAIKSKMGW